MTQINEFLVQTLKVQHEGVCVRPFFKIDSIDAPAETLPKTIQPVSRQTKIHLARKWDDELSTERKPWNCVESLPRDELRELQWSRLKPQLAYNYKRSPFYRRRFDEMGMKPEDIRS